MKVFWALIAVLVLATILALTLTRGGGAAGGSGTPVEPPKSISSSPPEAPSQDTAQSAPESQSTAASAPEERPATADAPEQETDNVSPSTAASGAEAPVSEEAVVAPPERVMPMPTLNEVLGLPDLFTGSKRREAVADAERAAESSDSAMAGAGASSSTGAHQPLALNGPEVPAPRELPAVATGNDGPMKVLHEDDGSMLVDDRFVLRGKGTKDEPYEVTWEMLMSAQETYQPRLGKKRIPERLSMLDGKWVKITGWIAFPIMAASPDEMLMMLNQWDGCCIGVPPTPYDAIEVKLAEAAKGEQRLKTSGVILGKLKVDPFLVRDWLVSLYLMDDAELVQ
jgi:hypothetical protein